MIIIKKPNQLILISVYKFSLAKLFYWSSGQTAAGFPEKTLSVNASI